MPSNADPFSQRVARSLPLGTIDHHLPAPASVPQPRIQAAAALPKSTEHTRLQLHSATAGGGFTYPALCSRLVELSGNGKGAILSLALELVAGAQAQHEPCAWVTHRQQLFYPPDAAVNGVDLDALVILQLPDLKAIRRATDHLTRSGAFGLIVVDLASGIATHPAPVASRPAPMAPLHASVSQLPLAIQSRWRALAQRHGTAIVLLTHKDPEAVSLGSLICLRGQTTRKRHASRRYICELKALKDKRRAHGWSHFEVFSGPDGLR